MGKSARKRRRQRQARAREAARASATDSSPGPSTGPPEVESAPPRGGAALRAAPFLALLALSVLAYATSLGNALVYDDLHLLPHNPAFHDPFDPQTILLSNHWGERSSTYRPFTVWTLALNSRLNVACGAEPTAPTGYRLLNLLLHAGVSALLFLLARELALGRRAAFAAAALYAVHPIHSEAVCTIVQRGELLAAGFGLLFLVLHRRGRLLPAGAAFLLAMASKESGLAFLALPLFADLLFPREGRRWRGKALLAYLLVAGAMVGLRSAAVTEVPWFVPFVDNPLAAQNLGLGPRLYTAAAVQLAYLRLQAVPLGLSSDYSYAELTPVQTPADAGTLGFAALLLGLVGLAWRGRRRHPLVAFVLLGYAATFAPTSNILVVIGTTMAERLTYAPSLFFCLLVGYGVAGTPRRARRPAWIALALAVGICAGLCSARCRSWADEETFFRAQVASAPRSAKAHYNLGTVLAKQGKERAAIARYERAVELFPYYSEPFYNLGNSHRRLGGNPAPMIEAYRNAIRYDPGHRRARLNLARAFLDLGRPADARPLIAELAELEPKHPALPGLRLAVAQATPPANAPTPAPAGEDLFRQGVDHYVRGRHLEAVRVLEQALAAGQVPQRALVTTYSMLARAYGSLGREEQAAAYQAKAKAASPGR